VTRIPRIQGRPPITAGSCVIRESRSSAIKQVYPIADPSSPPLSPPLWPRVWPARKHACGVTPRIPTRALWSTLNLGGISGEIGNSECCRS
jgi:hypothetical protein